jgi:hypothetical protein
MRGENAQETSTNPPVLNIGKVLLGHVLGGPAPTLPFPIRSIVLQLLASERDLERKNSVFPTNEGQPQDHLRCAGRTQRG